MICGSVESFDLVGIFFIYLNLYINFVQVFVVEMVIIVILMGVILVLIDDGNGILCGLLVFLLIGLLIVVIGVFMGLLIGFVMNLVCDIGLKVFVWLVGWGDVVFIGGKDIFYFLVLLCVLVVGVVLGVFSYCKLIGCYLFCDICVEEE